MTQNIDVRTKNLSNDFPPREDGLDHPNLTKIAEHLSRVMPPKRQAPQPEAKHAHLEGWSDQDIQNLSEVLRAKQADQDASETETPRISASEGSLANHARRFTKSEFIAILFSVISIPLAICILLFLSGWFILWSF